MSQKNNLQGLLVQENIKEKFNQLLGKRAVGFMTNILQITNGNDLLKNADPMSVLNSAMVSATLNLPINPNLGFAYIVPYSQSFRDESGNWQKKQVAQFQVGYKGFIQLAQRSGQFKTISATPIYKGQIVANNPLTGIEFDFTKTSDKIVGYASYFKLLNGFEKTFYMTYAEADAHAKKYSQTFKANKGNWKENFDAMALKTVIKLLLSKYAPLSVEMEMAQTTDQAVINGFDNGVIDASYIDNQDIPVTAKEIDFNESRQDTIEAINKCVDILELDTLKASALQLNCMDEYESKFQELKA